MRVLLGDSLEGAPQCLTGQLGLVAALHTVEQVVAVSLVELLGAQVDGGLLNLRSCGTCQGCVHADGAHERGLREDAGAVSGSVQEGEGLLATSLLTDRLRLGVVLLHELLSLLGGAQRGGNQQEVLLPVDAGALGDHGRRDLGEGLVQLVLLVGVVNEDQVGLEVCDSLKVRVGALADLGDLVELCGLIGELGLQVGGDQVGVTGGCRADGHNAQGEYAVELTGGENHDLGGCGFDGGFTAEVLNGAGEFAVNGGGAHAGGQGGGCNLLTGRRSGRGGGRAGSVGGAASRQGEGAERTECECAEGAAGDLVRHICHFIRIASYMHMRYLIIIY